MAKKPRIVFLGTSVFGQIVLRKLIEEGVKPVAVITQPDRPIDSRKTPSPVRTEARKFKIPVLIPAPKEGITKLYPKLKTLNPDLLVVTSFGREIPPELLSIAQKGALKLHPSLLPLHRGPAPIADVVLKGDEKTGVAVILMDEQTDHGPILLKEEIPVSKNDTAITLTAKLSTLGGKVLAQAIGNYLSGKATPQPQDHAQATYSQPVSYEDGKVNWGSSNETIDRMLRAYQPWPGVWTTVGELAEELERELKNPKLAKKILKILAAHQENSVLVVDTIQVDNQKTITLQGFVGNYLI